MKLKRVRAVSLTVLGIAVILLGLSRLLWAGVPDAVVRTLGVVVLLALPVVAFTTVRLANTSK